MAADSSSNSTRLTPSCMEHKVVFTVLYVFYILLLPLFTFVLYIGFQRWRKRRSAAPTSHTDVFTFHMATAELISIVGYTVYCSGLYTDKTLMVNLGLGIFTIVIPAQTLFHLLTCVERYLAVIHPVTYLGLRQGGGVRIRNISIVCVWLLSYGSGTLTRIYAFSIISDLILKVLSLIVVCFCSISVLCALIRPGPGQGGGKKEWVDQSKPRAFYTIMAIMAVLLLRLTSTLISTVFYTLSSLGTCEHLLMLWSAYWFTVPSSLVLPGLFLQRARKLPGCKR